MSHKKHSVVTAEVFIEGHSSNSDRAHLLEHVRFLENRTDTLEAKVEILGDMLMTLFGLDEEDEDLEDDEDEYEDEEDFFIAAECCCLWDEDESC